MAGSRRPADASAAVCVTASRDRYGPVVYCHCGQCRRTSGHFVAATAVAKDALIIETGGSLEWFASSEFASRGFCRRCGSSLFWRPRAKDHVSIMAGTLDKTAGLKAVEHIYVGDKGDYYDLEDDLPKLPRGWPE